jgi:hypothetical protein
MEIKNLFDPGKDIYRSIEKVITYDAVQENRLKAEISEYVVTENIEEQFEKLLSRMQTAMEAGGASEIGVWVSGFYGSGKSSFTKYLGFAFDDRITVDGIPFLKHLQDRLHRPTSKALLSTLVQRYPAAVVMVDLATDQLAGATMVEVSSVLYYKVLQWAGYSHNLKIAAFERKLKKDGRYQELLDILKAHMDGAQLDDFKNYPLIVDSMIHTNEHEMYQSLFKTDTAFT